MRKYLVAVFIIAIYFKSSFAQDGVYQFSKNYYRSDPFAGEFSGFLNHLLNDPSLKNKEIHKRTDSTLFYFSGIYSTTNYNPFFFKPKKLQVLLQEISVSYADSLDADTIFVYQLIAYADGDEKGKQEVKKEFEKIHRVYNKRFYNSNYQDLKNEEVITGGLHNYFVAYTAVAPVTTIWSLYNDEYILNISLRLKSSSNRAVLPASLDNP